MESKTRRKKCRAFDGMDVAVTDSGALLGVVGILHAVGRSYLVKVSELKEGIPQGLKPIF